MIQSRTVGPGWRRWAGALATAAALIGLVGPTRVAHGQTPTPPAGGAPGQVGDLTTRYKFIETYATDAAKAKAGEVHQYRVGTRDLIRVATETPRGAPDRKETTVQVIYSERPAAVNPSGLVTDTVRRYEAFQVTPAPPEARPSARKPLVGLTVWFRNQTGSSPSVMTLTAGRPLTETEYRTIGARSLYLPELSAVLPALPSRVGDRWRVPRSAARAILGDRPIKGDPLIATLLDVRKAPTGTDQVAVIGVTGRALLPPNGLETAVNAQVSFTFPRSNPTAAGDAAGTVEARGAITDLRLSRSSTSAVPGGNGRLRRSFTWELSLQRQLAASGEALNVPATPPTPDEANSWLTYDDPQGRFHFRHPQEMLPERNPLLEKEDQIQLVDTHAAAHEGRLLSLKLQPKTGNAETDKNSRDPDSHVRELQEGWTRNRQDARRGASGWLDKVDWEPHKMKVYRIEAAVKPSGTAGKDVPRIFLDHYLILFSQNESLVVEAMTAQDPPQPFRKQVEQVLKTFQLGPSVRPPG